MPYVIREDSNAPEHERYKVINQQTGDIRGKFPTEKAARQQQKALYANIPDADQKD